MLVSQSVRTCLGFHPCPIHLCVEALDPVNGNRALHIAAQNGHMSLTKYILEQRHLAAPLAHLAQYGCSPTCASATQELRGTPFCLGKAVDPVNCRASDQECFDQLK